MWGRGLSLRNTRSQDWNYLQACADALRTIGLSGFGLGKNRIGAATGIACRIDRLVRGDGNLALDMYRGRFRFAGTTFSVPPSDLFIWQPPGAVAARERADLGWLKHFAAGKRQLHARLALHLLSGWSAQFKRHTNRDASIDALMALCLDGPHLLHRIEAQEQEKFFAIVTRHVRHVVQTKPASTIDTLNHSIALLHAGTVFRGLEAMALAGGDGIEKSLNLVILPDGGHVSRNPQDLLALAGVLLPLRRALQETRKPVPESLHKALERMLPMLRMMSHGDDGLACFQGASPDAEVLKAILAGDVVDGRPLALAPHVGFARLNFADSVLLCDTSGRGEFDSPLALEFSDGAHRILSNCGCPSWGQSKWRSLAKQRAAHNAVSPDISGQTPLGAEPAELLTSPQGALIKMSAHYGSQFRHLRDCFLAKNGRDLRVAETLFGDGLGFVLRLHLHPLVRATTTRDGGQIVLSLPNKAAWAFTLRGGVAELEESLFLGDAAGPRKTQQIVIRGVTAPDGHSLNWALKKLARSTKSTTSGVADPELPF